MMVRSGWNSEYARKKYDVELDEADLARILIAGHVPLEAQATLPLADAHNLLWYSAEIMARKSLASFDPSLEKRLVAEARELNQQRADLLGKIRMQWAAKADNSDVVAAIQQAKAEVRQELGLEPLRADGPETQ